MALLEVSNLYKKFTDTGSSLVAVDHVNLSLEEGECLGLVGESGCGKSTTAALIMHLHHVDEGKIVFNGKELNTKKEVKESRSNLQMIFQNPSDSFDPKYTLLEGVKQGVKYVDHLGKQELDKRAKDAIRYAGLKDSYYNRKISQLSGGECQRAAIARAIISEPKLIICDEATSALDVSVQAQVIELLKRLQKEKGISYLFITHDLLLTRHICNRIAVMYRGSIVEMGDTKEILDNPKHPYTKLLLSCVLKPRVDKNFKFITYDELREPAPSGCKFYEYCPFAQEMCMHKCPELHEVNGRQIACYQNNIEEGA